MASVGIHDEKSLLKLSKESKLKAPNDKFMAHDLIFSPFVLRANVLP